MHNKLRTTRVLVLSLGAAIVAAAAFAGVAQAKRFVTDDGNISCIMRSHFVRCDVTKHKWTAPPKPKSCEFDYGGTLVITEKGKSDFGCVSDATGAMTQYPPGSKFRTGPNVCRLRKHGKVICRNDDTGHGFNVGRKFYDLF
jgi:hypothetical protein